MEECRNPLHGSDIAPVRRLRSAARGGRNSRFGYQGASGAGGMGNEPYDGSMNGDQYDRCYPGYGRGRDG